jgi:hypothetical protein
MRGNRQRLANNLRTPSLRYSNIRTDSQRRWDFSLISTSCERDLELAVLAQDGVVL